MHQKEKDLQELLDRLLAGPLQPLREELQALKTGQEVTLNELSKLRKHCELLPALATLEQKVLHTVQDVHDLQAELEQLPKQLNRVMQTQQDQAVAMAEQADKLIAHWTKHERPFLLGSLTDQSQALEAQLDNQKNTLLKTIEQISTSQLAVAEFAQSHAQKQNISQTHAVKQLQSTLHQVQTALTHTTAQVEDALLLQISSRHQAAAQQIAQVDGRLQQLASDYLTALRDATQQHIDHAEQASAQLQVWLAQRHAVDARNHRRDRVIAVFFMVVVLGYAAWDLYRSWA